MPIFNVRHVTSVQFITPQRTLTASPGGKTFQLNGLTADDYDALAVVVDGEFLEWLPGDDKEKTVAGQVFHEGLLTDASTARVMDAMRGSGLFAAGPDDTKDPGGQVWTTDFKINMSRDGVSGSITCHNVRWDTGLQSQISGNIIPYSGRFYSVSFA